MDKKLFCRLDKPYEAPTTFVFAIHSEGVLCQSYDRADSGYDNENELGEI